MDEDILAINRPDGNVPIDGLISLCSLKDCLLSLAIYARHDKNTLTAVCERIYDVHPIWHEEGTLGAR